MWTLPPVAERYREDNRARAAKQNGRPLTDYEMDMWCFNHHAWRAPNKFHFLLRAMQHQWPSLMLEQVIGGKKFLNYWAVRMVKEFCRSPIVDLMGCGSSGKTFIATCYGYTLWKSVPYHTSVYLSTTTGEGADARAWAVVNQLFREDVHRFGKMINSTRTLVVEEADELNEENAKFRDLRNAIKCVLIPTGNEGKNVVGAISGRKNNRVVWVCDEFSHMDVGVLSGRANLFTNVADGGWAQFIGCCNGPHEGSASMIDCEPRDGWPSVNRNENWRWDTRAGVCLYFNGELSPNMRVERGEKVPFPRLMDYAVRDVLLQNCWNDENTPEFFTQFFGFPPSVNIADTVLTKAFMVNNGAFGPAEWEGGARKVLAGLDLGFRKGGDPCIIHFGKVGKDTRTKTVLEAEGDGIPLNPDAGAKEAFEAQIAKKCLDECSKRNCHDVALDVTGDGGIMLQAIEQEARKRGYALNCLPVSFSGTAQDKIVIPGEKRKGTEQFANMVAQLWASARVCVGNGVVRGLNERGKATEQLCQRKFGTDEKKRFVVEKKSDMRLRIKRSPDFGDAFVLLVFLSLRHGLSGADIPLVPKMPKPPVAVVPQKQTYTPHSQKRSAYVGWR